MASLMRNITDMASSRRPRPPLASPSRRPVTCKCTSSAQPRSPLDVIIVGSGIGGLTAASALLEAGARVRIYEFRKKDDALTGPGGIQIQANAEKVLRLLRSSWIAPGDATAAASATATAANKDSSSTGSSSTETGGSSSCYSLSDAIYEVGGPIMSGGFRNEKGDYLYYSDIDSVGLTDIQSNGLSISRGSLQRILYSALPPGLVTFGRSFAAFNAPPPGAPGKLQ
ncbi:hypothetical protein Agub_g15085, partial [Astrephomene gubernaculifera]